MATLSLLNYAPNSFFVAISYAAASLLRYNRPQFRSMHNYEPTIMELVQLTSDMLDKQSGRLPGQYAVFLRSLIHSHSLAVSDTAVGFSSSQSDGHDERTCPAFGVQDNVTIRKGPHATLQSAPGNGYDWTYIDGLFDQLWDTFPLLESGILNQARETTGFVRL
jgi:hypothetical protein